MKQAHNSSEFEPITELVGKKTGRPSTLSDKLMKELRLYIDAIRQGGGVINTAIVIVAATGMLQKRDPASLASYTVSSSSRNFAINCSSPSNK